ncbi:MAG TPA: hypothetical protein VLV49_04035 [Terriglobales bacterium]|nr:hypothetical protein [Terriglobales bacterium]
MAWPRKQLSTVRSHTTAVHRGDENMAASVQVGTILIDDRPLILRALDLESEPYSGTWGVLQTLNGSTLEKKIKGSGWNCFFMAAEVKATVLGTLADSNIRRALKQIFLKAQKPDFNCLEVTNIRAHRFLGVPYITVFAHSRHIQQGSLLEFAGAYGSTTNTLA